jgi:spore coat polysaccharide biosynthesis predicted glycosyltransferase SpsG
MASHDLRVLFRAAAGPRLGFGHLVRCRSLARALGVEALVSLRGNARTLDAARRLGLTVVPDGVRPDADILVVDDPSAAHAARWVRRARRAHLPVATVHDLGLGYVRSDLGIDASVRPHRAMRGQAGHLCGPSYAILDPQIEQWRDRRRDVVEPDRVLIALGGGGQVLAQAANLAQAIAMRHPGLHIRVAAGFAGGGALPPLTAGQWIVVRDGLAEELARCGVALLAGGVSLYEACALGVPGVAVALTPAQGLTIRAVAGAGAVLDGGRAGRQRATAGRVAALLGLLLDRGRTRRRLSAAGRALVDGRGASRVAERLRRLASGPAGARHAA